jgi:predicted KAP-like P-loop ATPase
MAAEIIDADEASVVVHFNPWMFSGAEDLVGRFFGELAATLGKQEGKLRNVASRVAGYAGALSGIAGFIPAVGGTAASALAATQQMMSVVGEGPALENRRDELVEALLDLDGRIVAFLDDLDRLTDDELREVVRLVKLVGDLPNVTYILSFDRERVEQALGAPESDPDRARARGRAYLEKIVQSRHDVPPLRPQTIIRFMAEHIDAALEPYGERRWHAHDWSNMLSLALRHMVHTPRDAKRVANAVPGAMGALRR